MCWILQHLTCTVVDTPMEHQSPNEVERLETGEVYIHCRQVVQYSDATVSAFEELLIVRLE